MKELIDEDGVLIKCSRDHALYYELKNLVNRFENEEFIATKSDVVRRNNSRRAVEIETMGIMANVSRSHAELLGTLCQSGTVHRDELADKLYGGDLDKLRGSLVGLSKICRNRGLTYPVRHRPDKKNGGKRYYLLPEWAEALQALIDEGY